MNLRYSWKAYVNVSYNNNNYSNNDSVNIAPQSESGEGTFTPDLLKIGRWFGEEIYIYIYIYIYNIWWTGICETGISPNFALLLGRTFACEKLYLYIYINVANLPVLKQAEMRPYNLLYIHSLKVACNEISKNATMIDTTCMYL